VCGRLTPSSKAPVHVTDCLEQFCAEEALTGTERYLCEFCKARHDSIKKFSIIKLPEILCIHIKRFRHDSYWGSKIGGVVQFPLGPPRAPAPALC
jgi:ubiquitin carboxyl-terminal hydrolase 20/33